MTSRRATRPLVRLARQAGIDAGYLLVGLPLGVATFTIAITGLSLAAGLAITLIGIPVLVATLFAVRGIAHLERRRAGALLGEPVTDIERSWRGRPWQTTKAATTDPAAWRDVAWSLLLLPVGTAGFTVAVTLWSTALGFVTSPLWYWALPDDDPDLGVPQRSVGAVGRAARPHGPRADPGRLPRVPRARAGTARLAVGVLGGAGRARSCGCRPSRRPRASEPGVSSTSSRTADAAERRGRPAGLRPLDEPRTTP